MALRPVIDRLHGLDLHIGLAHPVGHADILVALEEFGVLLDQVLEQLRVAGQKHHRLLVVRAVDRVSPFAVGERLLREIDLGDDNSVMLPHCLGYHFALVIDYPVPVRACNHRGQVDEIVPAAGDIARGGGQTSVVLPPHGRVEHDIRPLERQNRV